MLWIILFSNFIFGISQAHPWFRGIDWENIHRYPAPYRPELRNPEDTRHFDDDIPAEVRHAYDRLPCAVHAG